MLVTKCVGDNFEMLVTVLIVFVANILYLSTLSWGTKIQKMSPISKFTNISHQYQPETFRAPAGIHALEYVDTDAFLLKLILVTPGKSGSQLQVVLVQDLLYIEDGY